MREWLKAASEEFTDGSSLRGWSSTGTSSPGEEIMAPSLLVFKKSLDNTLGYIE